MELNPLTSPALRRFPASQFRGLLGSGAESRASTAWHTDWRVQAGAVFKDGVGYLFYVAVGPYGRGIALLTSKPLGQA